MEMLSEREEFEYVEQTDDGCFVTIAEPYLRQEDERNLKKLTPREVEVMCASIPCGSTMQAANRQIFQTVS